MAENRKGMNDAGNYNVSRVLRKPLQCTGVTTPVVGHVVEVVFCSLIQHGFLPVFSVLGKIMLYSNTIPILSYIRYLKV